MVVCYTGVCYTNGRVSHSVLLKSIQDNNTSINNNNKYRTYFDSLNRCEYFTVNFLFLQTNRLPKGVLNY